jgi:hypothetical protein
MNKPRTIHTQHQTTRNVGTKSLAACGVYASIRGFAFWGPADVPCPKCAALALIASTNVEA